MHQLPVPDHPSGDGQVRADQSVLGVGEQHAQQITGDVADGGRGRNVGQRRESMPQRHDPLIALDTDDVVGSVVTGVAHRPGEGFDDEVSGGSRVQVGETLLTSEVGKQLAPDVRGHPVTAQHL